ncbi:MAG: anti-sigma factor antagonist [Clostridia bacterium]|nr:anti-sigma factor antagonist [Clostridia bacterium]
MEMRAVISRNMLHIALLGELDHHCASGIRDKIDTLLCDPSIKKLVFDLKDVTFMDSSGIGVILARAAAMKRRKGGRTVIVNAQGQIERVLRLSGVYTLVEREDEESEARGCSMRMM